jgi:hypothetical protein
MNPHDAIGVPLPGEQYLHYKGGKYEILMLSRHTETLEVMVIYRSLKYKTVWTRPLSIFASYTLEGPRFTRI